MLLVGPQFGEDRQCECLLGGPLGLRQVALPPAEVGEADLEMEWDGVVDLRADATGSQVLSQAVPLPVGDPDDVLIPDMPAPGLVGRYDHATGEVVGGEQGRVAGGIVLPACGPGVEMRQLHSQHCCLDRIEPAVDPD